MNPLKTLNIASRALALLIVGALAETAQGQCDGTENLWALPSTPSDDFVAGPDGTIVHQPTRLEWMRCALGQTWDGAGCVGAPDLLTWSDALTAAGDHVHAGRDDWRLPNRNELGSIVETRCAAPSVNAAAFPNGSSLGFWTSSPAFDAAGRSWRLDFTDGTLETVDELELNAVRLVRAGRP